MLVTKVQQKILLITFFVTLSKVLGQAQLGPLVFFANEIIAINAKVTSVTLFEFLFVLPETHTC
jgi:hypothetical protein